MDDPFEITQEDEDEIDRLLDEEFLVWEVSSNSHPKKDGWSTLEIAVPNDFIEIFRTTLDAYKQLRETEKTFPAFEAMVLEARNSLSGLE